MVVEGGVMRRTVAASGRVLAREFQALPVFMQQPAVFRHLASLPHDPSCSTAAIGALVAAVAGGDAGALR